MMLLLAPPREIWKETFHPDFEVSSFGRIRRKSGKSVKITISARDYSLVNISGIQCRLNRLICQAFYGSPPSNNHHAAHRNGLRGDNRLSNLYWATPRENGEDLARHNSLKGMESGLSILNNDIVRDIKKRRRSGEKVMSIWKDYSSLCCYATISHICNNRTWTHIS